MLRELDSSSLSKTTEESLSDGARQEIERKRNLENEVVNKVHDLRPWAYSIGAFLIATGSAWWGFIQFKSDKHLIDKNKNDLLVNAQTPEQEKQREISDMAERVAILLNEHSTRSVQKIQNSEQNQGSKSQLPGEVSHTLGDTASSQYEEEAKLGLQELFPSKQELNSVVAEVFNEQSSAHWIKEQIINSLKDAFYGRVRRSMEVGFFNGPSLEVDAAVEFGENELVLVNVKYVPSLSDRAINLALRSAFLEFKSYADAEIDRTERPPTPLLVFIVVEGDVKAHDVRRINGFVHGLRMDRYHFGVELLEKEVLGDSTQLMSASSTAVLRFNR